MTTLQSMTAEQIANKMLNRQPLFILDVRNRDNFQEWKIDGPSFKTLNIPYFELLDGVDELLPLIPDDEEVVIVCAKEGSSILVAEHLAQAGKRGVYYLQGGMKSWSEYVHTALVYNDEKLKVYQMIRMGKGCLSYLVVSGEEALVIDPARMTNVYQRAAKEVGAKIAHVVDSHLHADHISGGKRLAEETGARYYLMKSEGAVFEHEPFEEQSDIYFADAHLRVLAVKTPGHTPGSVSFLINDELLFSGDTLFVSGLGRPDLGGKVREWAQDLYRTVYETIASMADDVLVLPGHAGDIIQELNEGGYIGSSLGQIREQNEQMKNQTESVFVEAVVEAAATETPPNFEQIVEINRGLRQATAEEEQELEIGPNRCALHHTATE